MSLAAAPRYEAPYEADARDAQTQAIGAQTLLHLEPPPPNYFARVTAIILYFALLAGFVTLGFRANETPVEEQQVIELAPLPVEPPQVEDTPPPPEQIDIPDLPIPAALDPVAPVEEPKPVEKPRVEPKPEKRVERAPAPAARQPAPRAAARPAPQVAAPPVHAPAAPPGATPSAIANQFHACMQRAAASFDAPLAGRVSYHATFSASGSMTSYTISPSGKGALDSIANRLGARCGSVPAPGRPVSLSGAISFSP